MKIEQFVNNYASGFRDALAESGEWHELTKKEQKTEVLAAAESGAIQFEKLLAIYRHNKATSSIVDHSRVWRHMVARSCADYRQDTDRREMAQMASLPQSIIDQLADS